MRGRLVVPLMLALVALPGQAATEGVGAPMMQAVCVDTQERDPQRMVQVNGGRCTLDDLQDFEVLVDLTAGRDRVFVGVAHDDEGGATVRLVVLVVEAGVDLVVHCAQHPPTFPVRTWSDRCDLPDEEWA